MNGTEVSGGRAHIFAVAGTGSDTPPTFLAYTTGCRPPSLSSTRGKAGRNNLNEEITPHPLHWDRLAIPPNHFRFRTCSVLAPM
jgi:hypothetical protein